MHVLPVLLYLGKIHLNPEYRNCRTIPGYMCSFAKDRAVFNSLQVHNIIGWSSDWSVSLSDHFPQSNELWKLMWMACGWHGYSVCYDTCDIGLPWKSARLALSKEGLINCSSFNKNDISLKQIRTFAFSKLLEGQSGTGGSQICYPLATNTITKNYRKIYILLWKLTALFPMPKNHIILSCVQPIDNINSTCTCTSKSMTICHQQSIV